MARGRRCGYNAWHGANIAKPRSASPGRYATRVGATSYWLRRLSLRRAGHGRSCSQFAVWPPLAVYTSLSGAFQVDYPVAWSDAAGEDRRCREAPKCMISRDGEFMLVNEGRVPLQPDGQPDLSGYLDNVIANFGSTTREAEFIGREPVSLPSGLPAEILEYRLENGRVTVKEDWAAAGERAISVAFVTSNDGVPRPQPLASYIFDTVSATSE